VDDGDARTASDDGATLPNHLAGDTAMPRIRKLVFALLAALLVGAACTQMPVATPRTDTSPAATAPAATDDMSPDITEETSPSPS
jgi:hypothetical protein